MKYEWQHVVLGGDSAPDRLRFDSSANEAIRKIWRQNALERLEIPEGFEPADGLNGAWKPIAYTEAISSCPDGGAEYAGGVLWRRLLVSGE